MYRYMYAFFKDKIHMCVWLYHMFHWLGPRFIMKSGTVSSSILHTDTPCMLIFLDRTKVTCKAARIGWGPFLILYIILIRALIEPRKLKKNVLNFQDWRSKTRQAPANSVWSYDVLWVKSLAFACAAFASMAASLTIFRQEMLHWT